MNLTDLNPRWTVGHPDRVGIGVEFDCPGPCCAGKPSPDGWNDPEEGKSKKFRLSVRFHNPLDGGPAFNPGRYMWTRAGDTFETLSLSPSLDASGFGHWHGHVMGGCTT